MRQRGGQIIEFVGVFSQVKKLRWGTHVVDVLVAASAQHKAGVLGAQCVIFAQHRAFGIALIGYLPQGASGKFCLSRVCA